MSFTPYYETETVHRHRLALPHWRQWKRTCFITTRLADSIPRPVMEKWTEQRGRWLADHGIPPEGGPDDLLDAGQGECLLARPELADILAAQFTSGHQVTYQIDAWVIMPNHIHALVEPLEKHTLGSILQRWKGARARRINQVVGRSGSLWQSETFDHIVRSESQLRHFRRYIAENPAKAGLRDGYVLGHGRNAGITAEEVLQK